MFGCHVWNEHLESRRRKAEVIVNNARHMQSRLDQVGLLYFSTLLYNVRTKDFERVRVLVDSGSDITFVDPDYCVCPKVCEDQTIQGITGVAKINTQGVAVMVSGTSLTGESAQQGVAVQAYSFKMTNQKLLLSAQAGAELGFFNQHQVNPNSMPTMFLPELCLTKIQSVEA